MRGEALFEGLMAGIFSKLKNINIQVQQIPSRIIKTKSTPRHVHKPKGKERTFKISKEKKDKKTIKPRGDSSVKAKRQWNAIFRR